MVKRGSHSHNNDYLLVGLACVALVIGAAVYVTDRSGNAWFVPRLLVATEWPRTVFGQLGSQLPTFARTFAFTLLLVAALPRSEYFTRLGCIGWWAVESAFEIGQSRYVKDLFEGLFQDNANGISIVHAVASYIKNGTYDPLDLVSIGLGSVSAYIVIKLITRRANLRTSRAWSPKMTP